MSQPTETPARILALYEAASAVRGRALLGLSPEESNELRAIAADLDAQADAATREMHAKEVEEAKR